MMGRVTDDDFIFPVQTSLLDKHCLINSPHISQRRWPNPGTPYWTWSNCRAAYFKMFVLVPCHVLYIHTLSAIVNVIVL